MFENLKQVVAGVGLLLYSVFMATCLENYLPGQIVSGLLLGLLVYGVLEWDPRYQPLGWENSFSIAFWAVVILRTVMFLFGMDAIPTWLTDSAHWVINFVLVSSVLIIVLHGAIALGFDGHQAKVA
jgi:hypothetical protein